MPAAVLLTLLCSATPSGTEQGPAPAELALSELLELRDGRVQVSEKVRALAGARVRVRGWLVVFEERADGAFWLAPHPVFQDESGAGSGDLGPRSVRVVAPEAVLRALPLDAAPLEVVGRLEHGRQADPEGRTSLFRVIVEDPRDVARLSRVRPAAASGAAR